MRAFNVLLSLLVLVVLFLLALEGGMRLLGLGPPATLTRFDEHLGWSKKPDYSLTREGEGFEATIETNALGLRGAPMSSAAKPPGAFRVVMLGDSFTLGFTVDQQDCFVQVLADRWAGEGRPVDVINAGTIAYSTDQEAAWLKHHGAEFAPDLVVLAPYENDIYYNGQERYQRTPKPMVSPTGEFETDVLADPGRGGWKRTTALGVQLTEFARKLGFGPAGDAFKPAGELKSIEREFAPLLVDAPDFIRDALDRTRGSLIAIQRECEQLGADLVVAPIPSHSTIDPDFASVFGSKYLGLSPERWSPDRPVQLFLDYCEEDFGIEKIDARAALRAATTKGEDGQDCYLHLFNNGEWHFNAHGNRVYADFVAAELDRLQLLPPATGEPIAAALTTPAEEEGGGLPTWLLVYLILWVALSGLYILHYRDEALYLPPLKVGAILAAVFAIVLGGSWLLGSLDPSTAQLVGILFVLLVLGFVIYKLGRRFMTILELIKAFMLRGHWYLMPLVVVLLTIGSLLVVAASSPLVAPFIYTLF